LEEAVKGTIFEIIDLDIPAIPGSITTLQHSPQINLIGWVFEATPDEVITLTMRYGDISTLTVLHVADLACLLAPSVLIEPVFSFFAHLWDIGAINGWLCLSIEQSHALIESNRKEPFRQTLATVLKCSSTYEDIEFVLMPYEAEETYFLTLCVIDDKAATTLHFPVDGPLSNSLRAHLEV